MYIVKNDLSELLKCLATVWPVRVLKFAPKNLDNGVLLRYTRRVNPTNSVDIVGFRCGRQGSF